MSAGMESVLAAHKYEFSGLICKCGTVCGADEDDVTYAAHLAAELTKAGYGHVQEAKAEAWEDGKLSYFETTLTGRKIRPNPHAPEPSEDYDFGDPVPVSVAGAFLRSFDQAFSAALQVKRARKCASSDR